MALLGIGLGAPPRFGKGLELGVGFASVWLGLRLGDKFASVRVGEGLGSGLGFRLGVWVSLDPG